MKKILLFAAVALVGCLAPINLNDPAYVEQKAYRTSERITFKMLTDHPERRPKFVTALASLKVLEGKTNTTVADVVKVIKTIPNIGGENYWAETALLVFEDELERVGVKNPAIAAPANKGFIKGVSEGLEKTK